MGKYIRGCPRQLGFFQGLRLPFSQAAAGAQGKREASLMNGNQSRKIDW